MAHDLYIHQGGRLVSFSTWTGGVYESGELASIQHVPIRNIESITRHDTEDEIVVRFHSGRGIVVSYATDDDAGWERLVTEYDELTEALAKEE